MPYCKCEALECEPTRADCVQVLKQSSVRPGQACVFVNGTESREQNETAISSIISLLFHSDSPDTLERLWRTLVWHYGLFHLRSIGSDVLDWYYQWFRDGLNEIQKLEQRLSKWEYNGARYENSFITNDVFRNFVVRTFPASILLAVCCIVGFKYAWLKCFSLPLSL